MWKISGTALQGVRHFEENTPCQDKIYFLRENGVTSIALADGAGMAKFSHFGAEAAVIALCEKFCSDFHEIFYTHDADTAKKNFLDFILGRLEKIAVEIGCEIQDLSSTLLGAASDGEKFLMLHVGDGMIACFKGNEILAASCPDNGEFLNETIFITSPNALQRMRLAKGAVKNISGFALMSDGTDWSFFNRNEKKFSEILNDIKRDCIMENNFDLQDLFNSIVRNKTYDDCSMIIMCRPDLDKVTG